MDSPSIGCSEIFIFTAIAVPVISLIAVITFFEKYGSIDAAKDKWYEKDRAKCVDKAPVYGMTGQFYPYWDEDGHECLMLTQDSIYRLLDERSIRRRLEE